MRPWRKPKSGVRRVRWSGSRPFDGSGNDYREHLVALHGFIKKTRAAPESDLATARKRQKELER